MNLTRISKLSKLIGIRNSKQKAGLPPGTLIYTGNKLTNKSDIDLISYNEKDIKEYTGKDINNVLPHTDENRVNWLNIDGLHNIDLIESVGGHFNLHPLLLEDILNPDQRPKTDDYENHLFFTLKTLHSIQEEENDEGSVVNYEQISFVLGKHYLLSFQEKEGDLFDGLRERLRQDNHSSATRARKKGADYLFYRLIDTVVDSYYIVLEQVGEKIEELEDEVYLEPSNDTLKQIQRLKKELIFLRKSVYPLRESLSKVIKGEYPLIAPDTITFFSDVYDHTIHVIETIETYRDLTASLMDMYMTSISNKMNEVMKVLTIIATIFIPLTFIAGIYGMNFDNMPELHLKYGYFYTWGLMIAIFIAMIIYFKRKDWI
ncbi:magnesium/cobalt transporter CorA [Fulvivirga sediminis]|uniref:Magnesium transport protein CorA n=1 Tax=Fulvivirga sediminis TaxID=2803949 RepID=A0A937K0C6_9BACT|nr:magnesium/cobalt transporter CorA [Fulvivirga sediminis]MBL3656170.1 magnesium/cobalt transporter CorA [Fulvivirga sediminis]